MAGYRVSRWLFVVVLFVCFSHAFYYYARLPAIVPSHFGLSGAADAWSGKSSLVGGYVLAVSLCGILFGGIGAFLHRLPISLINLPNRGYWLAPERKNQTIATLGSFMQMFGSLTLLLLFFTFHQAFRVSMGRISTLEYMPYAIGLYCGVSLALSAGLFVKYGRVPQ